MAWRDAAVVLTVALAVGACSPQHSPSPSSSPTTVFAELVDTYLERPEADGYSPEQRTVLESARAAGELTFEDYAAAVDASLQCISEAGYFVDRGQIATPRGFPEFNYSYEGPETGNPVAEACILEHSSALESVYQLQSRSVEADDQLFAVELKAIEQCLADHGIVADPGLKGRDLYSELNRMLVAEVEEGGPPGPYSTCFGATP